ncbi:RHS repeat-associated protein [Variovorax paradoxus]|uniref:RHS repeat-associated core domain-containing protein n=1 Tax=Variovorax paradoxus TaxID=34073 RepID=UPI0033930604
MAAATTGATDVSPTTRYAHNALGQRVFKTEPLYPPGQGDEADPGFMQSLIAFFTKLWNPTTNQAEQLGYAYVYDENGSLISEAGSGGANSAGQASYIYLPTANGPMPIAAVINGNTYAVHSDHLNTPRRLSNDSGQPVWQWSYSAFGEDKPTIAKNRFANLDTTPNPGTTIVSEVKFNLRYPGQYADEESGLFYNYFRSYDARTGRYSQPDPIGLGGGWNRFGYVGGDSLGFSDPFGLDRWGSYGYGRYLPSTNPSPTLWERLNFPETPEQRALGENIAMAFCGGGLGGTTKAITRVGRWMSQAEYDAMRASGKVQESLSGTTHVADPADAAAFLNQARPGSLYAEFGVPSSSLKPTNEGWSKIIGPNSLEGRLAQRKGLPAPQMPSASGIVHSATKLP